MDDFCFKRLKDKLRIHWYWLKERNYEEVYKFIEVILEKCFNQHIMENGVTVKPFSDEEVREELKKCPKLIRDYVQKLRESNSDWQRICGEAIQKLKDIKS